MSIINLRHRMERPEVARPDADWLKLHDFVDTVGELPGKANRTEYDQLVAGLPQALARIIRCHPGTTRGMVDKLEINGRSFGVEAIAGIDNHLVVLHTQGRELGLLHGLADLYFNNATIGSAEATESNWLKTDVKNYLSARFESNPEQIDQLLRVAARAVSRFVDLAEPIAAAS